MAAYVITAFSYQYRFAHTNRVVYYQFWEDHYCCSAISNSDATRWLRRNMYDGPFWTTFWVDWRATIQPLPPAT